MAFLVLLILIVVLLIFLQDSLRYQITPNPTNKKIRQKLKMGLPLEIRGSIYELGSGFGHMSLYFSRLYPNAHILSFEKAKIPYLFQKLWLLFQLKSQIELKYEDFFQTSLCNAEIVFCYLYRSAMPKVAEKFIRECETGSWLISHTFAVDHLTPDRIIYADDLYRTPIYIYRKK